MTPVAAERIEAFCAAVGVAFDAQSLIRLRLGGYHGPDADLKSGEGKLALIKGEPRLSLTWRYQRRDETKNFSRDDLMDLLRAGLAGTFRSARLETVTDDLQFERNGDKVRLTSKAVAGRDGPELRHDREKNRPLGASGKPYLHALGVTDAEGRVLKAGQDKFRQINKMVEIFAPLIQAIAPQRLNRIVDMGSGKGYLTFALYDYLTTTAGCDVAVTGIEFRPDLVALCNRIAAENGFQRLDFVEGSIVDAEIGDASAVIALHACDTATDDAIFKGIRAGAELIAVAPCCHKQIRREIEANKVANDLDFLLRHGVFLERHAEMLTDGLRAQLLELNGYRTRVFEFISDAHTPKNVLIVAERDRRAGRDAQAIRAQIETTKAFFGIGEHHLERLLAGAG